MKPVGKRLWCLGLAALLWNGGTAHSTPLEISSAMRSEIPDATFVARYTPAERALAMQAQWHLARSPRLGPAISLSPNHPYADTDQAALNIWKPSFVLGTRDGGEAGINFWGLHNEGHINLAFTPHTTRTRVLDCRFLSAGKITYKIYKAGADKSAVEGQVELSDHHFLLAVPVEAANTPILVEMWPTPTPQVVGFFGCDLSEMR